MKQKSNAVEEFNVTEALAAIAKRRKASDALKAKIGEKAFEELQEKQRAKVGKVEIFPPNNKGKYVIQLDDLGYLVTLAVDAAKFKQPLLFKGSFLSSEESKLVGKELLKNLK